MDTEQWTLDTRHWTHLKFGVATKDILHLSTVFFFIENVLVISSD